MPKKDYDRSLSITGRHADSIFPESMSDSAAFAGKDVQAVWGSPIRCVLTGIWQFCDHQHVMGKGGKYDRDIHSSIFNMIPLNRDVHKGAYRDHPLMRVLFLNIARSKIHEAEMRGGYQCTDNDRDFLKMYANYYNFAWDTLSPTL